jgi:multidrug efflux system outer membrane protein
MNRHSLFIRATLSTLAGFAAALLFSCEVGPNYQRPSLDVPATFKSDMPTTTQAASQPATVPATRISTEWWRLFNDPELTSLEATAIHNNQNLRAAVARVLEARAAARITRSQLYPTITSNPSFTRGRSSANSVRGETAGGAPVTVGTASTANRNEARTTSDFELPAQLTYEVDVWGRIRRSYEASKAQLQASADDFQVVLQTLEADVAEDYFTLRSDDAQDKILVESVQSYRDQLKLTRTQLNAGLVSTLDLSQAQALLDSTITQEIDIRRQRADTEHAIAVLLGAPPANMTLRIRPLVEEPPLIPPGIPMDILRHRPDVAEAEQNLIVASANVGVATANFYPVFTLTSSAGFESFDLQHLLDWESRFWQFGPNVSIPLFEGGKLTASLEQAKQVFNENLGTYRQQVLTAFQDVEDALNDLHLRAGESRAQDQAVKDSQEYLRLSILQYRSGLIPQLTVIDANRTLLDNQLSQATILGDRMISTVQLIKALGGGWDAQNPAASQPAVPHYDPVAATRP